MQKFLSTRQPDIFTLSGDEKEMQEIREALDMGTEFPPRIASRTLL
jgi:hypothetical protein